MLASVQLPRCMWLLVAFLKQTWVWSSCLVQVWFKFGSGLVQVCWSRSGSVLVQVWDPPVWLRSAQVWFKFGSGG